MPFQSSLSHWGPFSFLSIFQCCYCGVSFTTPKITLREMFQSSQEMAGIFSKRLWIKCYLPLRRGRRFIHINLLQLWVRVAVLFNWFLDTRMKLANLTFFFPTYCEQLNASQEVVRTIWSQTCHERQRNRERGTLYPLDCFLLGTPYPLDHFLIRRILQLHCTDADLITSSSKALNRQANTARARWKDSNNETVRMQRNFLSS